MDNIDGTSIQFSSLLGIINKWNPDNVTIPIDFIDLLPLFNFSNLNERKIAKKYRDAEIPFKIYNIPLLNIARKKWDTTYIRKQFTSHQVKIERNKNDNHFLFWKTEGRPVNISYKPPTEFIDMPFNSFLDYVIDVDNSNQNNISEYLYFYNDYQRSDRKKTFMARDLSFLCPNRKNFFVTNLYANQGVECRFGMRGIIAEAHYDTGRNMVAMVRGNKRYILTPPEACEKLGIIKDIENPSYRQSGVDWSNLKETEAKDFDKIPAIDTVVREGEVLYIPSFWFHYIVSLSYSIQCNSRNGTPPKGEGKEEIDKCIGHIIDPSKYDYIYFLTINIFILIYHIYVVGIIMQL
jgi:hypothetical protein